MTRLVDVDETFDIGVGQTVDSREEASEPRLSRQTRKPGHQCIAVVGRAEPQQQRSAVVEFDDEGQLDVVAHGDPSLGASGRTVSGQGVHAAGAISTGSVVSDTSRRRLRRAASRWGMTIEVARNSAATSSSSRTGLVQIATITSVSSPPMREV